MIFDQRNIDKVCTNCGQLGKEHRWKDSACPKQIDPHLYEYTNTKFKEQENENEEDEDQDPGGCFGNYE